MMLKIAKIVISERQSRPPRMDLPSTKSFSRLVPTSLRLGSTYKSNVPKRTTDAHQHRPTHQSTSSSTHSGASDLDNSSTTFDWKRLKSRFPLEEGGKWAIYLLVEELRA